MSKSLSDKLNSHHNIRRNAGSRRNRVNFIVLKDDISEALEHGWPMTAIWETLHDEGKFTASYNTFRLYVLEYLEG